MKPGKRTRLLEVIGKRQAAPQGIGLASWYMRSIGELIDPKHPQAAEKYLGLGGLKNFTSELKRAGQKLVYRAKGMAVTGGLASGATEVFKNPSPAAQKRFARKDAQAPKSCMQMEAIYTSRRKDRDGDILEPKGGKIDPLMPLLWQHNAAQPIGRHLGVLTRNDDLIKGHLAIADTELGRDAAQLVEFGALRISHGFQPTEYEWLNDEDEDSDKFFPGVHVLEWEMMEVSLVSIPSNKDAVITAFSKNKLKSPLIKGWAQRLYDARGTTVCPGWPEKTIKGGGKGSPESNGHTSVGQGRVVVNVNLGDTPSANGKAKKAKEEEEEEEDEDGKGEEDMGDQDGAGKGSGTLLENVRDMLHEMFTSGKLDDEMSASCYSTILQVSEAIGAERHAAGSDNEAGEQDYEQEAEEEEDEDEWVGDREEDEEESDDQGDADDSDDDDDDEEDDEEEEDDKGEQPGWDGDDTDDENTGASGPPKHASVNESAELLILNLSAGRMPSKTLMVELQEKLAESHSRLQNG